jgi:hypothetical protein
MRLYILQLTRAYTLDGPCVDRQDGQEIHYHPAQRRLPMSSLTAHVNPTLHHGALFSEFRTVTKALSNLDGKPKTGIRATFGQQVGGVPVHKALTLSASKKVPIMQCLTKPVQSVEEARERKRLGGYTQAEINAKRSAEQAAGNLFKTFYAEMGIVLRTFEKDLQYSLHT